MVNPKKTQHIYEQREFNVIRENYIISFSECFIGHRHPGSGSWLLFHHLVAIELNNDGTCICQLVDVCTQGLVVVFF